VLAAADGATGTLAGVDRELLGVDEADITSVQRVHTVGEQVVVAVNTKPLTVDGVPRQVVLVGTPRG
jgi:hypothetical protein